MGELVVRERDGAVRFSVRVQPRASRSGVDGAHAGALRVRVTAAPVDGGANEALVDLLAARLGVPKRDVSIITGTNARTKVVEVAGVDAARVHALASD